MTGVDSVTHTLSIYVMNIDYVVRRERVRKQKFQHVHDTETKK